MCMYGGDDEWDVFNSCERRAAKDHRCGECGRTIVKGERYAWAKGLFDGHWSTYRTCLQCEAAKQWLLAVCSGYFFEMTTEDLRNHVDGDEWYERSPALVRLVRWQVYDWYDRHGNLRAVEDVKELTRRAIEASRKKGSLAA